MEVVKVHIFNKSLKINKQDLQGILTHIALCVEIEVSNGNDEIHKMDFVEIFEDEVENKMWINDLEDEKFNNVQIDIDYITK